MARTHQRVFAFIVAFMFLVSALAVTVVVIFQVQQDSKRSKDLATATESLKKQSNNITPQEGKLQGTKLEGFTPVATVASLQKIDLVVGTGEEVKPGATVTAHYTGALVADGTIFQSSHDGDGDKPIPFGLDQVIKGWTDGVPGMKVGGKRRLVIPYAMAYGEQGRPDGGIPAKADLVFDIEMVSVQQ